MRNDKLQAIDLRKSGKSYSQISDELKVSKSTLSGWFGKEDWSDTIKLKLSKSIQEKHTARLIDLNQIRGENLERVYSDARVEAQSEFERLKYNPIFISGIMLYWGEGDKVNKNAVKFTNTDPKMIQLYVFFLSKICNIPEEKIKAQVIIYPDLDNDTCKSYWAENSNLPLSNFTKTSVIEGRHKTNRLSNGICMVIVSSSYFKVKILEWIKLLPQALMSKDYYENI
jgi:hypothetical protein